MFFQSKDNLSATDSVGLWTVRSKPAHITFTRCTHDHWSHWSRWSCWLAAACRSTLQHITGSSIVLSAPCSLDALLAATAISSSSTSSRSQQLVKADDLLKGRSSRTLRSASPARKPTAAPAGPVSGVLAVFVVSLANTAAHFILRMRIVDGVMSK